MIFDEIVTHLGEFGRYQKIVFLLLSIASIPIGTRFVLSVFLQQTPAHRCAIPGYSNDTYEIQSPTHADIVNSTIPYDDSDEHQPYDKCHIYQISDTMASDYPENKTRIPCQKWVYSTAIIKNSAVTEMNMVCESAIEASHAQMIFSAGVLLGVFLLGMVADRIGRKLTFFISLFVNIAGGLGLAWAPNFVIYCLIRALNGATTGGMFTIAFVICIEMVGPNKRALVGILIEYFFALGMVVLAGLAYLIRDWHHLEMAVTVPSIIFFTFWWYIPESPRWLMNVGRYDEAEAVIKRIARVNKVAMPENMWGSNDVDKTKSDDVAKVGVGAIFKSPRMVIRSLVIMFNWLVASMVYYGLSLNTGNLRAGSLYVNFLLTGLAEFPAYTICILLLRRVGRTKLHCSCMVLGGAGCLMTTVTNIYLDADHQWVTVLLAMIGKLGVAGGFALIYVYTSEIFPTVIRNTSMGACSACARVGGMIAPYVADLGNILTGDAAKVVPLVIFGAASIAAGVLLLFLPETLDKNLPETIEDAINFGREDNSKKYESEMKEVERQPADDLTSRPLSG